MTTLQSSYSEDLPAGFAGMVANGETSNRITRSCEDATLGFGVAVFAGTGDHDCTATVGTALTFLGVTIATSALALTAGVTADEYQEFDNVPILTAGVIWVLAGEDVADRAQVYLDAATGEFVDTVGANILATGWVFDTTATSGNLVKIAKR